LDPEQGQRPEQKLVPEGTENDWGSKLYQPAPPDAEQATEDKDPRIARSHELEKDGAGAHPNTDTEKGVALALDAERERITGFLDGLATREEDPHYDRLAAKFNGMFGIMPDPNNTPDTTISVAA